MPNPVDNNLKKQRCDSLKFLKQVAKEKSADISDDLFEEIYDVVLKHNPDSSVNLSKEIEKLISNELEKKYGIVYNFTESLSDQSASIQRGIEILSQGNSKERYGKIGKEIVMRVTYFLSKTVVLLLYPPQIREMSARTCINLDIIIINVNINLCLAVLDQSRGGYLQCLHPHFY